jgi:hypothetical protein
MISNVLLPTPLFLGKIAALPGCYACKHLFPDRIIFCHDCFLAKIFCRPISDKRQFTGGLHDIVTLGYPPIAGFESILIADKSSVNSVLLRSSIGQVLAERRKYYDDIEYLLVNAKVKGGNSGGPVFDRKGRIIGIVVEISADFKNPELIDSLGYGIIIPSKYIKDFLLAVKNGEKLAGRAKLEEIGEYSYSVNLYSSLIATIGY